MAWKARLAEDIAFAGDKVTAQVEFYDDASPSVVLHEERFAFPPSWSNQDMQGAIQSRGKAARDASTRAGALRVAFPQATTVINIP